MPASEYTAVTGGALKLKGGSAIDKKKKKKKPKPPADDNDAAASASASSASAQQADAPASTKADLQRALADEDKEDAVADDAQLGREVAQYRHKTEAERKYEERRRRRLDDRLKREGVKTHKERVEELNKYLSTLSEHHDMPRIGPG